MSLGMSFGPMAAPWQIVYYAVLQGIPTTFEALGHIGSLRAGELALSACCEPAGGLDERFVRACIGELHTRVFEDWLLSSTAVQFWEVERHLRRRDTSGGQRHLLDGFREWIPEDAVAATRQQFDADLRVILAQMGAGRTVSGAGDGSGRDAVMSTVAEVMQRTKTCRGDIGLTLTWMSRQMDVPAKYLGQEFHDIAGIRFRDYSRTLRLLHAARLVLKDGVASLKEVVHKAGYSDEGDFSRDFSRVFLQGPAQYRRRYAWKRSLMFGC